MWITDQLGKDEEQTFATTADVILAEKNKISTSGLEEQKNVPIFTPYGVQSVPPNGESVFLINGDSTWACVGSVCNNENIKQGEVKLFSKGGATILLKNNGDIILNGVRITKDGQLIKAGD